MKGPLSDPDDYLSSYIEEGEDLIWAKPEVGPDYEDAAEDQTFDLDLQLHERSLMGITVYLLLSCLWPPSIRVFGDKLTLVNAFGLDGYWVGPALLKRYRPPKGICTVLWTALQRMLRHTSDSHDVCLLEKGLSYLSFPVVFRTVKGESVVRIFVFR